LLWYDSCCGGVRDVLHMFTELLNLQGLVTNLQTLGWPVYRLIGQLTSQACTVASRRPCAPSRDNLTDTA
jgi:hypothetical protein